MPKFEFTEEYIQANPAEALAEMQRLQTDNQILRDELIKVVDIFDLGPGHYGSALIDEARRIAYPRMFDRQLYQNPGRNHLLR